MRLDHLLSRESGAVFGLLDPKVDREAREGRSGRRAQDEGSDAGRSETGSRQPAGRVRGSLTEGI